MKKIIVFFLFHFLFLSCQTLPQPEEQASEPQGPADPASNELTADSEENIEGDTFDENLPEEENVAGALGIEEENENFDEEDMASEDTEFSEEDMASDETEENFEQVEDPALAEDEGALPDEEMEEDPALADSEEFPEDDENLSADGLEEETIDDGEEITGELTEDAPGDMAADAPPIDEEETQTFEDTASAETEDPGSLPPSEEVSPDQMTSEEPMMDQSATLAQEEEIIEGLSVITNIRYSSELDKIFVDSSSPLTYETRTNPDNRQFILEIPNSTLSENLKERPFIMKEFTSDIALLQADQKDTTTSRILIQMREAGLAFPNVEITADGVLQISPSGSKNVHAAANTASGGSPQLSSSILPAKTLEDFFMETPQFSGRPISLHLQNVEVKDVLYFISEGTGLNMVISDEVSGNISLKLREVPWDQAFLIVMKNKNLGYLREGNVIHIMTMDALKKKQSEIQDIIGKQKQFAPLRVKVIPIIYSQAVDLVTQITPFQSPRGKLTPDGKSNSLIVTDTEKKINELETLIKRLDKSPIQVMIETKFVEATEDFDNKFGFGWSFRSKKIDQIPSLTLSGTISNLLTGASEGGGRTFNITPFKIDQDKVGELEAFLSLSESDNHAQVISAPRVMVLNGEQANISQSSQIFDVSTQIFTDQAGGSSNNLQGKSVARNNITLSFSVTPTVTPLGSIFLEIDMKREFPGALDVIANARPINSREAKTKVLVNNGQTIVIGGIYQNDESQGNDGFPVLKDIPVLKWFFSSTNKKEARNELLLFLTPKLVDFKPTSESTFIN